MVPPEHRPDESAVTPSPAPRRRLLLWAIATILAVLGGSAAAGWYFLRHRLIPELEAQLTPILGRPVELGEIETLNLSGVRLGPSALPPTVDDPDLVEIPGIAIDYNLGEILRQRAISARVTVENPRIYIEQAKDGNWLDLELNLPEPTEEGDELPVDIARIEATVQAAEVILVPRTPTGELGAEYRVTFPEIAATATEDLERVAFAIDGALEAGTLKLAGDLAVSAGQLEVAQAQLQDITLAQFLPLIPLPLPVEELQGSIAADLTFSAQLDDPANTFAGNGTLDLTDLSARLPQLQEAATATGKLRLQGQTLAIETLAAQAGGLRANVVGTVSSESGYNLTATVPETPIAEIFTALKLDDPPVSVRGAIAATARATGAIDAPQVSATLRTPESLAVDRVNLGIVEADARLDDTRAVLDGLRLDAPDGGRVRVTGEFDLDSQDWSGDLVIRELDGAIARPYLQDAPFDDLGRLNASASGRGNLQTWTTSTTAEGNFDWNSSIGRATAPKLEFANQQIQADLAIASLVLQAFVPDVPPNIDPVSGELQVRARLPELTPKQAQTAPEISLLETVDASASGQFRVAGGDLRLQDARLQNGRWQVRAALDGLPVGDAIPEGLLAGLPLPTGVGSGANLAQLWQPTALRPTAAQPWPPVAPPSATAATANAAAGPELARLQELLAPVLLGANLSANGRVDRLDLNAIDVEGNARLDNVVGGTVTVPSFGLKGGQGRLRANVRNLRLDLLTEALEAPLFAAPTPVTGEIEASARVDDLLSISGENLSPLANLRANGQFTFANGLAVVTDPLNVAIAWDGKRFNLVQASAPGFQASGFATLDLEKTDLEIVGPFDFEIAAEGLDLGRLPLPPEAGTVRGFVGISGRATGGGLRNPPPNKSPLLPKDVAISPQFSGNLRLRNLIVNNYTFDPELAGTVRADLEQGFGISLAGERDILEAAAILAAPDRPLPIEPQRLRLRLRDAEILGQRSGEEFQVTLKDLPLQQFQPLLPDTLGIPDVAGEIDGSLSVNLSNFDSRGTVEITQLQAANTFRSNLIRVDAAVSPRNGRFTLNEGRLQVSDSEYRLQAEVNLDPQDWQNFEKVRYQARLEAPQVRLRDIFSMLQLRTVADLGRGFNGTIYGDASDLDIIPIELADASLGERLKRLNTIEASLADRRARQTMTALPPFSAIAGDFSLVADISGQGTDLAAAQGEVTLDGQAWQWGEIGIQETTIRMEVADGRVTIVPVRLATGDSSIELTGSADLNLENLSLALAVREVPVELARNFVEFPPEIGFGGNFEADVAVSGSPTAPNATGEFTVANATINQVPIARVGGGFTYNQSQLLFAAESAIAMDSEPATVIGTVPLQLPTSPIAPPSDRLEVSAAIRDEALAFLDVLTNNQVKWGGGKGAIELDIAGPFDLQDLQNFDPAAFTADGRAAFTDAQLVVAVLSEPITGITGAATFDLETLRTDGINAQLGGGAIAITGALPFFTPSDEQLTATISELEVDALDGLFESRVEGTLAIGGTALATRIGGDVRAFRGTLDLANLPPAPEPEPAAIPLDDTASFPEEIQIAPENPQEDLAMSLQLESGLPMNSCQFAPETPLLLQDLRVEVGPLFKVSVPLIADFFTEGAFTIDGPLLNVPQVCPQGLVTLERGTISIGSARFRLDNDEPQTATFIPEQGLDPTLDVTLQAQVVETTRQPESTDPSQTEFADDTNNSAATFGAAESVRIIARVQGRASGLLAQNDLKEILVLESTPRRTENEILALLGEGVLGGGSALGLASSLTGNLQAEIANALGLSQFSLFPIAIADSGDSAEGDGGASTRTQLAAETGIDLTNKITFSVLAILTQQQPLLYSLRYRVNDKISIRGLTDFSANDRLTVDYETRF